MNRDKILQMPVSKIYPLLVQKAERKGRTKAEVDAVIFWLTGYTAEMLEQCMRDNVTYGDFFRDAPHMNENRSQIRGVVCGVRVEEIEDEQMREIRYLDKLVDELAKGKALEKILRGAGGEAKAKEKGGN